MKVWKATLCLVAVGLLACNGKTDKISEHWLGSYDLNITYGPLDEFSSMFIGYTVEIYRDSCVLFGMGYQTGFTDLCKAQEESGNVLHLMYRETIEESAFTDHSRIDTLATLIKDGRQYYIKSSVICDKDWEPNKKIPLRKSGPEAVPETHDTLSAEKASSPQVSSKDMNKRDFDFYTWKELFTTRAISVVAEKWYLKQSIESEGVTIDNNKVSLIVERYDGDWLSVNGDVYDGVYAGAGWRLLG